jgi:hypothetical protein
MMTTESFSYDGNAFFILLLELDVHTINLLATDKTYQFIESSLNNRKDEQSPTGKENRIKEALPISNRIYTWADKLVKRKRTQSRNDS